MNTKDSVKIAIVESSSSKEMKEVPSAIFGQKVNHNLLTQYIQSYLENQREGNASTKDRSQVAGTTKKMYKQKGTGNARHGSAKAPIFKGGGVVGGPKPHEYSHKINKKQKSIALVSALSQAASANEISVLSENVLQGVAKTKDIAKILSNAFGGGKMVLVTTNSDKPLVRATRNMKEVSIVGVQELNPYFILFSRHLLFSANALKELIARIS